MAIVTGSLPYTAFVATFDVVALALALWTVVAFSRVGLKARRREVRSAMRHLTLRQRWNIRRAVAAGRSVEDPSLASAGLAEASSNRQLWQAMATGRPRLIAFAWALFLAFAAVSDFAFAMAGRHPARNLVAGLVASMGAAGWAVLVPAMYRRLAHRATVAERANASILESPDS